MALDETTLPFFDTDLSDTEAASPTAHLLDDLQLYGYRPFEDEPDPRPLPEPQTARGLLYDSFDAIIAMLADTRLEADLPDVLWSMVNLFHRRLDRIERDLDDNEQAQRRRQCEQDGSEVKSVELERLIGRDAPDRAPQRLRVLPRSRGRTLRGRTGSAWRPRSGSMVNHRALTAAMIDSRDFKRNDQMLEAMPVGVVVFPGNGVSGNPADKAKKLRIPVMRFDRDDR